MKPSPLLLESHSFDKIELQASENPDNNAENLLRCALQFSSTQENAGKHLIKMKLDLLPREGTLPPYTGSFVATGVFSIDTGFPEDKAESLLRVNGPSLLYGMIREMLMNLTARSAHGAISLRTVSFADFPRQATSAKRGRKKGTVKKKAKKKKVSRKG